LRSSIAALVFALLLAPAAGRADTAPTEAAPAPETSPVAEAPPAAAKAPVEVIVPGDEVSHRELAGHVFIPSHFVLTPFSNTSFGMSLAGAVGTATGPVIGIDPATGMVTKTGTADYPLSAFGPSLEASIRLLEFLDLRLGLVGLLFTGTTGPAALVVGSGFQLGGNLGVTAGMNFGEHVRAGLTFDFVSSPQFNLLVLSGIATAIASGMIPAPSNLLSKTNTITVEPGLVAAWAPWRFIGGTVNFQYLHPTTTGSYSSTLNGLALALLADFDLMQVVREVPLGLTATYKWITPIGSSGVSSTQDLVGGLFYTGRKDLALGLEIGQRVFHVQDTLKSSATFFYISVQYYW
jgi:hypothetical protein